MIVGELHYEMVFMLGPKYIISHHEPNSFMEEYSLSDPNLCGNGMYVFDAICSLPVRFT